jgi:hypothetical protein
MSLSFAERYGLAIAPPALVDSPIENSGGTLARVLALASLARQKDPSLPQHLRATRRVPEGLTASEVPFRLMFTADNRSELPEGVVSDTTAVEFWEAVERAVPGLAATEQQHLTLRVRQQGVPGLDAAMEEGYRRGEFSLKSHPRADATQDKHYYSTTFSVPEDAFLSYPDLGNLAFLSPGQPDKATPIGRLLGRYQAACQTLSRPLEQTGATERQALITHIQALNRVQKQSGQDGTFEENHRHGWIAYALAQGGTGWTHFLLQQKDGKGPLVSPYAPYGTLSPLTMAVGTNDRAATEALMDAGVSPNTVLRTMPQMFGETIQKRLNQNYPSDYLPILVFAAATNSPAASAVLLKAGAEVNFANEKGFTALHLACANGADAMAHLLDRHHADFTAVNANRHVPDELIPQSPLFDSLHRWAQGRFEAQNAANGVTATPTLGQRVQDAGLTAEDPEALWTTPATRPTATRRSKSNP